MASRSIAPVSERVAAGVAMVPEDRKVSGFVGTMTVEQNMTLSSLDELSSGGYLAPTRERTAAARFIDQLADQGGESRGAPMGSLSGGNQQKVVIARAAMSQPRVLLMDEPTRGVDVGAKAEILESMRRMAADGLAVVFASSDLAEVRAGATRILVMARGRVTADVAADRCHRRRARVRGVADARRDRRRCACTRLARPPRQQASRTS